MSTRLFYRKNDLLEKEGAQTMSDLQELTNELMQDVAFRREYEALQPERPHVVFDSCEKGSRTYAGGVIRENRNQPSRYQQNPLC